MGISSPKDLFAAYSRCVVHITTKSTLGDHGSGTGFHIGGGYIVTARHVVEGRAIVGLTSERHHRDPAVSRVVFPEDPRVDLAVLETDSFIGVPPKATTGHSTKDHSADSDGIPLGGHLDDWIGDEFVLSKVIVMGYPPVPTSKHPVLVVVEAEVNAVVDRYLAPHPHFVLSYLPRGGFSGAPVISEFGFLLGVATESLLGAGQATENGFAVALSVEPLLTMLYANTILPGANGEFIRKLFRHEL